MRQSLAVALAPIQYQHRVNDCRYIVQRLLEDAEVMTRIDSDKVGIAGHSFGAITALECVRSRALQPIKIAAAIALSPGGSAYSRTGAFLGSGTSLLCITGSRDNHVVFGVSGDAVRLGIPLSTRLAVYRAFPWKQRQLLLIKDADHMAFAGERLDGMQVSRDAAPAKDVVVWGRVASVTTRFWQRHLMGRWTDAAAYIAAARRDLGAEDEFRME